MQLFELFGKIAIDSNGAINSIRATTDEAEKAKTMVSAAFSKIGKAAVGLGVTAATGFVAMIEKTRDYRTEMGKLDTAFITNGFSSDTAREAYSALYAVLGETDQTVEAVNHLSKLCSTEQEVASWTDICTGVFATFGDSLPVEGLTEAANETAKVGQVVGPLADALNWAGVSEDAFNAKLAACNSEQERAQLITSTLTGLYAQAAAQYKETNQDVMDSNLAHQNLTNTLANLSAVAEPILTKLIQGVTSLLSHAQVLVEWAVAHEDTVIALAIGIGTLTAAIGAYHVAQTLATTGMTVATLAATTLGTVVAFLTSPITLAIAAFGALVAAGVLLYKNWDTVKAKATELYQKITEVFGNVKTKVLEIWNGIWDGMKGILNNILGGIETMINGAIIAINGLIEGLNDLIAKAGSLMGISFAIPSIPKITIPRLEQGGILEKGQMGFLEGNGAEAVVPLDQNRKWISAVAEDMAGAGIGGSSEQAQRIISLLEALVETLPESMKEAMSSMKIEFEKREVARMVKVVV